VLAYATRQGRITRGQKDKVIQVGTGEAQGPSFICERNPGATPEIRPALVAPAISVGDEDL
jgi:hypothetical protein